jgi:dienelactone hydrolase
MVKYFLPAKSLAGSMVLLSAVTSPAIASSFTGAPIYTETKQYSTLINGDLTDIYFPVLSAVDETTPIVLLLQGALVDKSNYSNYAQIVASYGFTVVVPNNRRIVPPGDIPIPLLFSEQGQVHEVLDFMTLENANRNSPVAGQLNTTALGLLGHSFGGSVGLAATQDICFEPVLCTDGYSLPEELKAGIFYGTNFDISGTGIIPPIENEVPTGLIFGTQDGVADPAETVATFKQLLHPPKVLVEVDGANHYGITNEDSDRDDQRPTLEQAVTTETIGRWSGAFLRAHVLNDSEAWDYVYQGHGDAADENVKVTAVAVPEPAISLAGLVMAGILGTATRRRRNSTSF